MRAERHRLAEPRAACGAELHLVPASVAERREDANDGGKLDRMGRIVGTRGPAGSGGVPCDGQWRG
ncbi:hypothetical protein DB32_007251 [Sandaracinus amylolyticus]|uniref:Uncharacterized protein n=1 Tax=Sandaracinus amylolyticus TaxID=927083 RepID=A0A0F6W8L7_9BACT|nr:hypothetical protein DB32_007251 [Sandaracinus amylolyticus]